MFVQDMLQTLNRFWTEKGCILWQPYHTEVGAGTSNPATFLRVLGPEPWSVAYPEPSTRPTDGRYGENPNRLQHYYQYQVILKPSPPDVQELYLQSLEALGLDLKRHDFRFVEDNWQSPSLGAWGLGWEAWLDGMEILQFTYFQECGGVKLDVRACELTYGVERIAMYIQGVESVYDLKWAPSGITYGDIYHKSEVEYCHYNFEQANTDVLFHQFDQNEAEGLRLVERGLIMPAYDHCLRLSHLFNLLDARGALSVSERGRFLLRCRVIAERCAKGFLAQREEMGFPLRRLEAPRPEGERSAASADALPELPHHDTLLLEIGVEELPHRDVQTAMQSTPDLMARLLAEQGIAHGPIKVCVTPRRIAVFVEGIPGKLDDTEKEVRGPKRAAAQDEHGQWKVPAQKFAEANGVTTDAIYFQQQGKDECCFVKATVKGKHLAEVLSAVLPKLLKGIPFGKSMGWEDTTVVFSRPVRWLVALHGDAVVPATWTLREKSDIGPERALETGRVTYGHRRLAAGEVSIPDVNAYQAVLRDHFVLVDRVERMASLRQRVQRLAETAGLFPEQDEDLFEEICDLVEWPEPILCEIPEEALGLPEAIIITPMKVHQRYIPLRTKDGALSRNFLAVANGEHDAEGRAVIKAGNERVLNARLRDAAYFWNTDTRTPLAEFAKGLSKVLFHKELGSVSDKVSRLRSLYAALKGQLPAVNDEKMDMLLSLMKADLTTQMVFEFDSLQGFVGMLYARKEGLDEEVAQAIFEHWLPRRAGDTMPAGSLGMVAGLLDRFDSLAGYFGIGIRPKGTSDPFGLRRNALAVLALTEASGMDINLEVCIREAIGAYGGVIQNPEQTLGDLLAFFRDRMDVMGREKGHAYDRVASALVSHGARPRRFLGCVEALGRLDDVRLQDLAEQAKRMQRIAKEPAKKVDASLLEPKEKPMAELLDSPCDRVRGLVEEGGLAAALDEVSQWAPIINTYFEDILVNADDGKVRMNRHALIRDVLAAMTLVADFTQIEKSQTE